MSKFKVTDLEKVEGGVEFRVQGKATDLDYIVSEMSSAFNMVDFGVNMLMISAADQQIAEIAETAAYYNMSEVQTIEILNKFVNNIYSLKTEEQSYVIAYPTIRMKQTLWGEEGSLSIDAGNNSRMSIKFQQCVKDTDGKNHWIDIPVVPIDTADME